MSIISSRNTSVHAHSTNWPGQLVSLCEPVAQLSSGNSLCRKRILLAEDDSVVSNSLNEVLRTEIYETVLAENGQQAIDQLVQQSFDLLLLDIGLPVKTGLTILTWLDQVNPLFPVIVITGQFNQRELVEKLGADALIEKPIDMPRLLQTIKKLLAESTGRGLTHLAGKEAEFQCHPETEARR